MTASELPPVLYVIVGHIAVAGERESVLATTTTRSQAERHLDLREREGYYARIVEYVPKESGE